MRLIDLLTKEKEKTRFKEKNITGDNYYYIENNTVYNDDNEEIRLPLTIKDLYEDKWQLYTGKTIATYLSFTDMLHYLVVNRANIKTEARARNPNYKGYLIVDKTALYKVIEKQTEIPSFMVTDLVSREWSIEELEK